MEITLRTSVLLDFEAAVDQHYWIGPEGAHELPREPVRCGERLHCVRADHDALHKSLRDIYNSIAMVKNNVT